MASSIRHAAHKNGDKKMSERWDRHFLELALTHARMSKDPNTRVGAIIVGPDREVRSAGFNGFPRGIADDHRLLKREVKLGLIVHAEMNAVLAAARIGTAIKGCSMYLAATDDTGDIWGGPPCTRCVVELLQTGISEIISFPTKARSKWLDDLEIARSLLEEAGVSHRELQR
jgi:dCMP deaminase